MKVSELIKQLQILQKQYGDHELTTFDGQIGELKFTPARDGIAYPMTPGTHNETGVEIITKWS